MKKTLCLALLFLMGTLAFGQCGPLVNGVPDYFGCPNWANSPLPGGIIANIAVTEHGSGYTTPRVIITDLYRTGSGAAATAVLNTTDGSIDSITIDTAGSGYVAPIVTIVDDASTGSGALASAVMGPDPLNGYSGGIRKFVNSLPGLGPGGANDLTNFIPVAVADTTTYSGSDYYEIELGEFTQKLHSDLNPTTLRGYRQTNGGDGQFHYLGPLILAQKGKPVRIKFTNKLATGAAGNLFLPADTTVMGSGMGPMMNMTNPDPQRPMCGTMEGAIKDPGCYSENRATVHLHGGLVPWISDGTQHQWVVPKGEQTDSPKGDSVGYVPDMWFDSNGNTIPLQTDGTCAGALTCSVAGATNNPGAGALTFYYPNEQSARLMFYHDHAYGITRLNVYAGEVAGYLLRDSKEQELITAGTIPADEIPLIIQDKTFLWGKSPVTATKDDGIGAGATDPTWPFAFDGATSNLWLPHVYIPNQNPWSSDGTNAYGRWDYGPWFWPPWPVNTPEPNNPYCLPTPGSDCSATPWQPPTLPSVPYLSTFMEAFMDTPVVNGTPYPYLVVEPKPYRFRILNGANDRFWNLQLYKTDPAHPTEVPMVQSNGTVAFPAGWPKPDLRDGGVPDPTMIGPKMIQIGTEGGFLPAPVVWPNIPIGWDMDPKSMTVGNVKEHNLFIGPAERADVIVDFSGLAEGTTLILYNDAPAAVPARDPRWDYYTGNGDQTDVGGTPNTLEGYGPNTRTLMQIRVGACTSSCSSFNLAALQNAFKTTTSGPGVFMASQDDIIVPQAGYNSAYNLTFPADRTAYVRIQDTSLTFKPLLVPKSFPALISPTAVTMTFNPKAIAEEFEDTYGRMSAFLGVEVPFTNGMNQTTIFYTVHDPSSEVLKDTDILTTQIGSSADGTQIWKITHNGVDTHPIHFHLYNVQLLNRVDWAGVVKPPEPNELGWKETVRMNPLEDAIVAFRPAVPKVWDLPNSNRVLDPTMAEGSTLGFKNVDVVGNPATVVNTKVNFGAEYVWHCHILGHEEMDMMRPVSVAVAPKNAPVTPIVTALNSPKRVRLTFVDNSINETSFTIQRMNGTGTWANIGTVPSTSELATGKTYTFDDQTVANNTIYKYQVRATNKVGYVNPDITAAFPVASADSAPSALVTAGPPVAPSNVLASQPGTKKTDPVVITWTDNAPDIPSPPNYTGEDNFTVRRATSTNGPWTTLTTTAPLSPGTGATVTYRDTTTKSGTTYYYQVSATNKLGESTRVISNSIKTR